MTAVTTPNHPDRHEPPIQVLYVEDSNLHAAILKAGLSTYNIEVLHLPHSDESLLEELSRSRYDAARAIILDLHMGELSGLQVARRLRAAGDNRPILLISAADQPSKGELMSIQAMFLPKPFEFERISDTIKKLAAHS